MASEKGRLKVVLTGGGSAGHVSPLLAVADALRQIQPETQFRYIGVKQGLEALVVPRNEIKISFAPSIGLPPIKNLLGMLRFMFILGAGILRASSILASFRPDVIVASGGFASAPAVFAATFLRIITLGIWKIPVYLHEQNAVPGRMNLLAGRFASKIGLSYEDLAGNFPKKLTEVVGYPIREQMQTINKVDARKQLKLDDNELYLVVFGGSQGARTINRAIIEALPFLSGRDNLKIKHAYGTMNNSSYNAKSDTETCLSKIKDIPKGYSNTDYVHDLPVHLAAADLAVIRAGAGSLLEVCARGVPSIVIPKANLPGDSQVANARELEAAEAIEILYEEPTVTESGLVEKVSGKVLAAKINTLLDNPENRKKIGKLASEMYDRSAAKRVAASVVKLADGQVSDDLQIPAKVVVNGNNKPGISNLSATVLRRKIEKELGFIFEQSFQEGTISDTTLAGVNDLDYIRYRASALLVSGSWMLRNEGVKLLGLTGHKERLDLLLHVIADRSSASRFHRLIGGDYYHVGFERRNALSSLALHGLWNEDVEKAVLSALDDPYYEVRSSALKFIRTICKDANEIEISQEIVDKTFKLTKDKRLEVMIEAIHTLGYVADPGKVIEYCSKFILDNRVLVRDAILKAYEVILSRKSVTDSLKQEMLDQRGRFLLTSVEVYPYFPVKERFSKLYEGLKMENQS